MTGAPARDEVWCGRAISSLDSRVPPPPKSGGQCALWPPASAPRFVTCPPQKKFRDEIACETLGALKPSRPASEPQRSSDNARPTRQPSPISDCDIRGTVRPTSDTQIARADLGCIGPQRDPAFAFKTSPTPRSVLVHGRRTTRAHLAGSLGAPLGWQLVVATFDRPPRKQVLRTIKSGEQQGEQ